jgi:hypothetical protein
MKIGPLNLKIEREPSKAKNKENWERLKDTVDKIFEVTANDRTEMRKNLDFYNGIIFDDTSKQLRAEESKIKHNVAFDIIQSIAPMLSDNKPIFGVVARQYYMQKLANAYDMSLKYFWDKNEMNMTVHKVVLMGMIKKVGLFKVWYDETGDCKVDSEDPEEFFIAPGFTDPWEAPYCGIRGKRPISYIRQRFDPNRKFNIKPDEGNDWKDRNISYGKSKDFELSNYFATLYEVWMKDDDVEEEMDQLDESTEEKPKKKKELKYPHGKYVYFTNDVYLGTESSESWHGRPCWVPWYNYVKPQDFLGTSEIDNIKDIGKEFNLLLLKIFGYIRRYADPNFFYDTNQINQENFRDQFVKGGQGFAYDGTNSNKPPVSFVQPGPMPSDIYQMVNLLPHLIEKETGSTDVSQGVAAKKQRQSASEIAVLVESSYTRTRQRVRNLEWSLKRVCWLLVNLMQQYYDNPRSINFHNGDQFVQDTISNSTDYAQQVVAPNAPGIAQKKTLGQELNPREQEEWNDYQEFVDAFGEKDNVYFDYDIEIQTNSTLPLDKQSLANLALRLYTAPQPAIDRQAVLETLHFPNAEEIIQRMEAQEQAQNQNKGGGAPPEMGPGPGMTAPNLGGGMAAQNEEQA